MGSRREECITFQTNPKNIYQSGIREASLESTGVDRFSVHPTLILSVSNCGTK